MKKALLVTLMLALLAAQRGISAPAGGSDLESLQSMEKILREAQRQERVSGDMMRTIRDFRQLVVELQSNGMLEEAKGAEMVALAETLDATDRTNVKVAAEKLRDAGKSAAASKTNLTAAEAEIQTALDKLQALLRDANALQASEMLNGLLTRIIEQQAQLTEKSTGVGKELLAEVENLSQRPEDLSKEQERVAGLTAQLEELLKEAVKNETTAVIKLRLMDAATIMEEERVRGRLGVAAESLGARDFMYAVAEQTAALKALRDMAKALSPDASLLNSANIATINAIRTDQTNLLEKVKNMTDEEFKKKANDLLLAQKELEKRLKDALAAMKNAKPGGGKKPDKVPEGSVNNPPTADVKAKPFESKMKGNATGGFGKAGDNPPPPGERKEGGSDPTDKAGAGPEKAMVDAQKDISQKDQPQAMADMKKAADDLGKIADEIAKAIMKQGGPKVALAVKPGGKAKPDPNGKPASAPSKDPPPPNQEPPDPNAKIPPPSLEVTPAPPDPKAVGKREFMVTGVYGVRPAGGTSDINTLASRDRDSLGDNFARELPREYRDMLKAYYETLARE
jgi:hypothetical protein